MPDGSMMQIAHSDRLRVNGRLVHYGKVLLQQAKGDEPDARDDRTPIPKRIWTGREEASAWEVQRGVVNLPARERFVVNVFYKGREADYWHEIDPIKQRGIENEMCREINARMRSYCATIQELPRTIRGHQVQGIREAAIRLLVAAGL